LTNHFGVVVFFTVKERPETKDKIMIESNASRRVSGTKGARRVDRLAIANLVIPPATDSWCPVGHVQLLDQVERNLDSRGFKVVGEEHFIGRDAARYFGRLSVQPKIAPATGNPSDYGFFVGLRNSTDKSFASTIGFGTNVYVCSNGCFSAEHILNRKHTPEILVDLPPLVDTILCRFGGHTEVVKHRFDTYKHIELADGEAHDLIIRGAELGATNYRQVPTIVGQWKSPDHPEFKEHRNVWRLFNAFTEAAKMGSEADLWDRSLVLQDMFDKHVGFVAPDREVLTSATETVEAMALN
jgi:hypothetical protein